MNCSWSKTLVSKPAEPFNDVPRILRDVPREFDGVDASKDQIVRLHWVGSTEWRTAHTHTHTHTHASARTHMVQHECKPSKQQIRYNHHRRNIGLLCMGRRERQTKTENNRLWLWFFATSAGIWQSDCRRAGEQAGESWKWQWENQLIVELESQNLVAINQSTLVDLWKISLSNSQGKKFKVAWDHRPPPHLKRHFRADVATPAYCWATCLKLLISTAYWLP
jgi:hypothetical protein